MGVVKKLFIDFYRCVGCRVCEIVCSLTHEGVVSPVLSRIRVVSYEWGRVPTTCLHCGRAPCVEVCPTRALYVDEDGAVMLMEEACVGCMVCALACPLGVPQFNHLSNTMFKCDLCVDRRQKGEEPACVKYCPTNAIMFGDVDEVMEHARVERFAGRFVRALRREAHAAGV